MDKKNIIITGAGGGIGVETVAALDAAEARLICVDIAQEPLDRLEAPKLAEIIRVQSAIDSKAECERIVAAAGGPIHGLVHLAGILRTDKEALGDMDLWDSVLNANLRNAYELCGVILENLDETRPARMVFAASLAFRRGAPVYVAYSASKGGLVGLTRALSRRLGPRGTANAVAPGIIETQMPAALIAEHHERLRSEIPLNRFGSPAEVASVIAFLMSDASSYVSGQVINIDGGTINS